MIRKLLLFSDDGIVSSHEFLAIFYDLTTADNTDKSPHIVNDRDKVLHLGQINQILHVSVDRDRFIIHPKRHIR